VLERERESERGRGGLVSVWQTEFIFEGIVPSRINQIKLGFYWLG
jgi:hypothetical protein